MHPVRREFTSGFIFNADTNSETPLNTRRKYIEEDAAMKPLSGDELH